eukprot:m.292283 g.292283  ORF g.292283 m.292283 type:complete len:50 (-) comp222823_c0_seq1:50-199(-)
MEGSALGLGAYVPDVVFEHLGKGFTVPSTQTVFGVGMFADISGEKTSLS